MSKLRKPNGLTVITSKHTALVADEAGNIELLMPSKQRDLSEMECLLAAVAMRLRDRAWVEETLAVLADAPARQQ